MGRSGIGFGALLGSTLGGFLPSLWGGSSFSVLSLACAAMGGVAGVLLAVRLIDL